MRNIGELHLVWIVLFGVILRRNIWDDGAVSAQLLQGETAHCASEGALVSVPHITNNPCINCRCEHYRIICEKKVCQHSPDNCYFHLDDSADEDRCCSHCKGCTFQDEQYSSGDKWSSKTDACVTYQCQDGIITKTPKTICYTPCTNPIAVHDQCCPVCKGCFSNGKVYNEGDTVPVPDRCVQCTCSGGNLVCDKTACPVLACPVSLYINEPGSCCPKCHRSRKVTPIVDRCLIGHHVLKPDQQITVDTCTTCTCMKSTLLCKRQVCPVLACPTDFQQRNSGECCPSCMPLAPVYCETEEATYNNGETWKMDPCTVCSCDGGQVRCSVQTCQETTQCKDGEELHKDKTDCCQKCVPKSAVCTIYGDPHYRTFDGRSFSFQGQCKYVAVEECKHRNKRFEVQVRNDARKSSHFTWTKSVAIHVEQTKIILLQKLRVRVNRKEVRLPFIRLGSLSIISNGYSVVVRTLLGLKVTWDGDSYVEISLPSQLRNQVCGLCGNYNGNATDDLMTKDTSTLTDDVVDFAQSWLVTRKSEANKCAMPDPEMASNQASSSLQRSVRNVPCQGRSVRKGVRVLRDCSVFKKRSMLACRRLVDPEPFYKNCLEDMCDCPRNRACLCQSVLAFLRECERRGGSVDNLKHVHCKKL